ncbi:hypothetical protein [Streptomyces sp. NPDC056337]|uniref:hypothetical protein n=1 Tax=Streptomyces sp. NPDC056337 TaxID=3345787 RepID=UPI0035DE3217
MPLYADSAPPGGYLDAPDGYLAHLREREHVAAVIRPDFYLFGAAADASGVRELVAQLREQLRHPVVTAERTPAHQPLATAGEG